MKPDSDGRDDGDDSTHVTVRLMDNVAPRPGRVIWHRGRKLLERARELRASAKDFAGRKRVAIRVEAEDCENGAAGGRNLYLCEVCGVWGMWGPGWASWGTMDEVTANVCSDACKRRFRQKAGGA